MMEQTVLNDTVKDILDFWFQGVDDLSLIDRKAEPFNVWFKKDEKFDQKIKRRFGKWIQKAADGECEEWEATAEGRLALVLLFDQFTRNIYRGTSKMFAYDELASELCKRTIMEGKDADLPLIYRTFLFMPLMHSEDLDDQELGARLFHDLVDLSRGICPENSSYYEYTYQYAIRHLDVVKRFNRFPHRNEALSRESAPAELKFLKQPGSSF